MDLFSAEDPARATLLTVLIVTDLTLRDTLLMAVADINLKGSTSLSEGTSRGHQLDSLPPLSYKTDGSSQYQNTHLLRSVMNLKRRLGKEDRQVDCLLLSPCQRFPFHRESYLVSNS